MKKLGILIRPENTKEENEAYFQIALQNDLEIILLNATDQKRDFFEKCRKCDGLLLTGGYKNDWYDDRIIDCARQYNVPLLGICQGMQSMAIYKSGKNTIKIGNDSHHLPKDKRHIVRLESGRLKEILKTDKIWVNSHHYEMVEDSNLFEVTGYSEDGIIEVVENKNHPFQIGVQWHPERMMESEVGKKIIESFINTIKDV